MSITEWFKGSHSEVAKTNKPDALHDELHQTQKVTIYGVSNRLVSNDGKSFVDQMWTAPLDQSTHYFREDVQVSGKPGSFDAVSNSKPEIISKQEYDKGVAAQVKAAHGKLGVFTHGIRTAAGEAAASAAELTAETGKPFVIEDWASTKSVGIIAAHQEKVDDRASFQSQTMIDMNVEDLVKLYGAKNIDMVAHSRGSMNQIRALADLQDKDMGVVNSATFAHSDVDLSDFELALPSFQNAAKHLNVVFNPDDGALRLSELRRFGTIANLGESKDNAFEQSARLGRVGLDPGDGGTNNSYVASNVPNYFSIAKDGLNDRIGHAFAPALVASMIEKPSSFKSFSTLKLPAAIEKTDCFISPANRFGKVIAAIPFTPFRVLSAERAKLDIVSDSPEVQRYIAANNGSNFALLTMPRQAGDAITAKL